MLAAAAVANAQLPTPTLPYLRTYDVLVVDNTADNVYRLSDFNLDGDYYDAGEVLLYYDDLAFGDQLSNTTGMVCSDLGTTYVCDSSTDRIVALRDLNYDGDALDAGEAVVFFDSATNASGVTMMSASDMVASMTGELYVLSANSGTATVGDGIIKLQDLNGDGDANDLGEASFYFEVPGSTSPINLSVPSRFALGPDNAFYYADMSGVVTKGIYRAFDADVNGVIDGTEYALWWATPSLASVPAWYGVAFDVSGHLYVTDHGGGSTVAKTVRRAFDLNGSGAIDPGSPEEEVVYTSPVGAALYWGLLRRDDGTFLMIDSTPDALLALNDLNADGDFDDAGENVMVFDDTTVGLSLDLRAMSILRAPKLEMAPATIAIGQTTNFVVTTTKPFDIAVAAAALSLIPPFPLAPFGNLEIDPLTLILFGSGISDAQGLFSTPLTFSNDVSLIGTYGCQALCLDGYRMFLSNSDLLTVTPPAVPQLVINEVDYDQIGTDADSFIEILNTGSTSVNLAGLEVRLINGANSTQYASFALSAAGATLAPGQYLVIANPTVTVAPSALVIAAAGDFIQNGAPDGIALFDTNGNQMIDALSYEGAITAAVLTGIPGTWNLVNGTPFTGADSNSVVTSLARLPDGIDSGDDSLDWALTLTPTPGASNL